MMNNVCEYYNLINVVAIEIDDSSFVSRMYEAGLRRISRPIVVIDYYHPICLRDLCTNNTVKIIEKPLLQFALLYLHNITTSLSVANNLST